MKTPRFPGGVDPGPSFAYDDQCGTRRSPRNFLSLCRQALLSPLRSRGPRPAPHDAVFFPMHHTKYAQLAPMEAALGSRPLFILAPWSPDRIRKFNEHVRSKGADWILLEAVFPLRIWADLLGNLPYWISTAAASPRLAARRLAQYLELYGLVHGIRRIMSAARAKAFFTAYEDSWYSSAVSQIAKADGFLTINVMHGNCYRHDQFFDVSVLFGEYHRNYLETHTRSRTHYIIAGSATIKGRGAEAKSADALRLIYFDQPACDAFPGAVKAKVMAMLKALLAGLPGASLAIKPHPAGSDPHLAGFLEAHPTVALIEGNVPKSVAALLEGKGISMTAFSTTGLEAIANGTASLFLNPEGALSEGPLAFMGEFALRDPEELMRLASRLVSEPEFYREFLGRQKKTLEKHYALGPFDYPGFLQGLGLLGASRPIS
jgi:hypothetical protein